MNSRYYIYIEPASSRTKSDRMRVVKALQGDTVEKLQQLQDHVGGDIEVVPVDEGMAIVINEAGRAMKMRKNERASLLAGKTIVGPALAVRMAYKDGEIALMGFDDLTVRKLCYQWKRACV